MLLVYQGRCLAVVRYLRNRCPFMTQEERAHHIAKSVGGDDEESP
jgi:hypothetical protein